MDDDTVQFTPSSMAIKLLETVCRLLQIEQMENVEYNVRMRETRYLLILALLITFSEADQPLLSACLDRISRLERVHRF
jgi:hypothetical protein